MNTNQTSENRRSCDGECRGSNCGQASKRDAEQYAQELEIRLARCRHALELVKANDRSQPYQAGEVRPSDDLSPVDGAWATPFKLATQMLMELGGFDDDNKIFATQKELRDRIDSLERETDSLDDCLDGVDEALNDAGAPEREGDDRRFYDRLTRIKKLGEAAADTKRNQESLSTLESLLRAAGVMDTSVSLADLTEPAFHLVLSTGRRRLEQYAVLLDSMNAITQAVELAATAANQGSELRTVRAVLGTLHRLTKATADEMQTIYLAGGNHDRYGFGRVHAKLVREGTRNDLLAYAHVLQGGQKDASDTR